MTTLQPHPTAGWYPDPESQADPPTLMRWWDGATWTVAQRRWTGYAWIDEAAPPAGLPMSETPAQMDPSSPAVGLTARPMASTFSSLHTVPPVADVPHRRRRLVIIAATLGGIVAAAVGALAVLLPGPERAYLEELRAAGLGGQYSSDANAIASGQAACARMRGGEPQTGSAGDAIAVKHFCPEFSDGFHVLSEITVEGSFTLVDYDYYSSIDAYGSTCEGTGGYSDISAGTPVVLKNGEGEILATTSLGVGTGDSNECVFSFTLPVKEGESDYVVSVSHRGEMHYTFTQLDVDGIALSLGD